MLQVKVVDGPRVARDITSGLQIQCGVNFFILDVFGGSQRTQGAGIRYQNTPQIQILLARHFEKKGRDVRM